MLGMIGMKRTPLSSKFKLYVGCHKGQPRMTVLFTEAVKMLEDKCERVIIELFLIFCVVSCNESNGENVVVHVTYDLYCYDLYLIL
ncbi:uncharacterized protein DS421_15g499700 [Arachis hypogaea]|nr:uncharacterized protein DS421_15g499700 [Arachis hypogaea]